MSNKYYEVQVKSHIGGHWEEYSSWSRYYEARHQAIEAHARSPFLSFRIVKKWVEERELEVFKGIN